MLRGHVPAVQDSQAHAIVNSDVTNRAYVATAKVGLGFLQFLLFSRFTPNSEEDDSAVVMQPLAAAEIAKRIAEPR